MLFDQSEPIYLVVHNHHEPAFNLACEEYYFHQKKENYILLWRNSPAIIIGRNQNAYAELDMDYVRDNSIPVIRRLTGGGAVYHDLGNLNFTFIANGVNGLADFQAYLKPVTDFLCSLGLKAEFSGRNDILINGMKVSGNAQANYKDRVMLHGTLLFSVALNTLSQALKPNPLKLKSKGIQSVKSRVTNIHEHLEKNMDIAEFMQGLAAWLSHTENCIPHALNSEDEAEIQALVTQKYCTWSWNIGSSPAYSMESTALLPGGLVTVNFNVTNGIISALKIFGDFFGSGEIHELEQKIIGTPHERQALLTALERFSLQNYISRAANEDFANLFFS